MVKRGYTKYVIEASDSEGTLRQILEALESLGKIGHSCSIIVDTEAPKNEQHKFYWDGDGSDRIYSIKSEPIDDEDSVTKSFRGVSYKKYDNVWKPID